MSQGDDIVFNDLDVAKREDRERVITELRLMVDDILYIAKELPNGGTEERIPVGCTRS